MTDKQTGHWMNVWSLLTQPNTSGLLNIRRQVWRTLYQNIYGMGGCMAPNNNSINVHHFVPLQFWFCRNPGLALSLIALQYHVKVVLNHTIVPQLNTGRLQATPQTNYGVIYLS